MINTCENCGKSFQTIYKRHKYCCSKCGEEFRKNNRSNMPITSNRGAMKMWDEIVRKTEKMQLSYGKLVAKGML